MIISHKYKFIFIRTKKTATTSIESYLSKFLGEEDVITHREGVGGFSGGGLFNPLPGLFQHVMWQNQPIYLGALTGYRGKWGVCRYILGNLIRRQKFYDHMPAFFVKQRLPQEIWDNYFKFTIERNPFDKVISYYYSLMNTNEEFRDLSFEDYMSSGLFRCLNYPLYMDLRLRKVIVDRVIYYESLEKELKEVFEGLDLPFSELGREKGSFRKDRRPYSEFFDGEYRRYRDVVEREFGEELVLHGYEF